MIGFMHPPSFSIAPMMDWTDRHCRFFHRLLSPHAVLYSEMVTAEAILHGDKDKLLGFSPQEHPVILQLGGSDPAKLAKACQLSAPFGYDEINLNVGCPSDRVQSGRFGACLMAEADLVAQCVDAMQRAVNVPITVKCRIGIDDQIPEEVLPQFLEKMQATGCKHIIIHARKAWLKGLSPKENRTIPPLNYDLVYAMKRSFPTLMITINGGVETAEQVQHHLNHVDGVMVGRAAYHTPLMIAQTEQALYKTPLPDWREVIDRMIVYSENIIAQGGRFHSVARHLLGLFQGYKGARHWRRTLSEKGTGEGVDPKLLWEAFQCIEFEDFSLNHSSEH
jgi:tRNA-dihydrouridine synthase A